MGRPSICTMSKAISRQGTSRTNSRSWSALLRPAALQPGERRSAVGVERDDLAVEHHAAVADGGGDPGKFRESSGHVGAVARENGHLVVDHDGRPTS